jgi:beta-lactamase class D OXA-2
VRAQVAAILISFFALVLLTHAQEKFEDSADWGKYFGDFNAKGTIVVADERRGTQSTSVYD